MSRLTSFVLGYHGCERALAEEVISGKRKNLRAGKAKYHWLGEGIYFWEDDPHRALEWAIGRPASRALTEPCVVGAVIDMRNCLDLRVRQNVELVKEAHQLFLSEAAQAKMDLPENQDAPNDKSPDLVMRYLDYAVIERLHKMAEETGRPPFDTVRALFHEGVPTYAGSGFREKTHTEIAVRTPDCIVGYFLPRPPLYGPRSEAKRCSYVFPGPDNKRPLSTNALRALLQRMGETVTAHGFRSSFRDWCGEVSNFPRELAEQALAHRAGDATELAYRRGDAVEKRRKLMESWANYCGRSTAPGNVHDMRRRA